ncbi:hypothetical protein [Novosphingobium sp.]|uniref:hypothetical protein n=1 Tax=Novosphingobium sp. TaxID=1874826 RepID=UPI003340392A
MTPHLLSNYAAAIRDVDPSVMENPHTAASLEMDAATIGGKRVQMIYAPFDHVNSNARLVIVGMTPGRVQAANALRAARQALIAGKPVEVAAAEAKIFASFSGPMRANLVRMLDHIGISALLGISSTAQLWTDRPDLVHFTSAMRYPVFVDGENWSGQPDMVRTRQLAGWLEAYTGTELADLKGAIIVPLGPKVAAAMQHLASQGVVDRTKILDGLPHPSGANAERIAFFLGDKPAERCSAKTNPAALTCAREALVKRITHLRWS